MTALSQRPQFPAVPPNAATLIGVALYVASAAISPLPRSLFQPNVDFSYHDQARGSARHDPSRKTARVHAAPIRSPIAPSTAFPIAANDPRLSSIRLM
jgi:hypothetical protein